MVEKAVSIETLQQQIKVEERKYRLILAEDKKFEEAKTIFIRIKELKRNLVKQINNNKIKT